MLLKALYDYATENNLLETAHLQYRPVHLLIPIDMDGKLVVNCLRTLSSKNRKRKHVLGRSLLMPRFPGDNNGSKADFLAARSTYIFGFHLETGEGLDADPANCRNETSRRRTNSFHHFWDRIDSARDATSLPELDAIVLFKERYLYEEEGKIRHRLPFIQWSEPKKEKEEPKLCVRTASGDLEPLAGRTLTFEVAAKLAFDSDVSHPLNRHWRDVYRREAFSDDDDDQDGGGELSRGVCLITGGVGESIALSHNPKIHGIPGAGTGARIVACAKQCPSFSSYGFSKAENAPASQDAAASYALALEALIKSDDYSVEINPVVACFWTKKKERDQGFISRMLTRPDPLLVRDFLRSPWAGIDRHSARLDAFYSVTLSANKGRVVVRHWLETTVAEARENLRNWFVDLNVVQIEPWVHAKKTKEAPPPLAVSMLAGSTVRDPNKELRADSISALLRGALEGTALPISMAESVLSRLRADMAKFGVRALTTPIEAQVQKDMRSSKHPIPPPGRSRLALLKLILNRTRKAGVPMIEPTLFVTNDAAYNCGRLLGVLADAQAKAHEYGLEGPGIGERYFGSASVTPCLVFPLLLRLNRHHLDKIKKSERHRKHAGFIEDDIQNILMLLTPDQSGDPPEFPRRLDLHAQGRFAIGFYQQKAASDAARKSHKKEQLNQLHKQEASK